MKKLIAILATAIAAVGFSACAQDWITFETGGTEIWDNASGTPNFDAAGAGNIDAVLLWAPTGTADLLTSVGTEFGQRAGAALDQVGTNATSVASANPEQALASMLSSGWSIAKDVNNAGSNAVANSGTGTLKGQVIYNGGTPFEVSGVTGTSGSDVEEIILAYNGSAGSWTTATALGWSNPFQNSVGTSAGDPNATSTQANTIANQFAIAPVPEPATLALAGLGGLSMLFLRRRKA